MIDNTLLAVNLSTYASFAGVAALIIIVGIVGLVILFRDLRPAWNEGNALGAYKIFLRTHDGIDDVTVNCVDLTSQIRYAGAAVLKMLSSVVRNKYFEVEERKRTEFLTLIMNTDPSTFVGDGNFCWAFIGLKSSLSRKRAMWCLLEKGRTFDSYAKPSSKKAWNWGGWVSRRLIDGDFIPVPFGLNLGKIGNDMYTGFFIPTAVIHSAEADLCRATVEKFASLYSQFFSLLSTAQPTSQLIEAKDKMIADLEALRRQDQATISELSAKGIADTMTGKGLIKLSGGTGKMPAMKGKRVWLTYLAVWAIPLFGVGLALGLAPHEALFSFVGLIASLPVVTMVIALRR